MDAIAEYGSSDEDEESLESSPQTAPASKPAPELQLDNSKNHQGRIRTFPHTPGNFPVHVYVEVPVPPPAIPPLDTLLQALKGLHPDLCPIDSTTSSSTTTSSKHPAPLAQPSYHVSLSHTAPIRLHESDSLLTALRNSLHTLERFNTIIHPILEVFVNDERTRTFLALKASAEPALITTRLLNGSTLQDPLLRGIAAVSEVFELHGLPGFYSDPRPHISIAWLLGDQRVALEAAIGPASEVGPEGAGHLRKLLEQLSWKVEAEAIWCKIGSKRHAIWRKDR